MPASRPLQLSVVIITLNEVKRIGDCLDSVRDLADDVVVIDTHSRDATRAVCAGRGARVFERAWSGYSAQKNFGNARARHDWVLSLDADERVSPELAAAMRAEFARGPCSDAYSIRFENYFGRQRIRFGAWNPEYHVRLFDRRLLAWNEDDVHESLCSAVDVRPGRLRGCIRHLTVDSRAQLAAKTDRYSALFAAKVRRRARPPGLSKVWLNPAWRFVRDYAVRLGALDGAAGAAIAWESARYTHFKYARALPAGRPLRLLQRLTMAAGCGLLALSLAQAPWARFRGENYLLSARIAVADIDDDFTNMNPLSFDDDDVVV